MSAGCVFIVHVKRSAVGMMDGVPSWIATRRQAGLSSCQPWWSGVLTGAVVLERAAPLRSATLSNVTFLANQIVGLLRPGTGSSLAFGLAFVMAL
jgi:hypothetical protein